VSRAIPPSPSADEPIPAEAVADPPAPVGAGGLGDEALPTSGPRSRLLRDNLSVAAGTAVGRVTGFVKVIALAAAVDSSLRDTYLLANNTPNIIFELILGGVLTATLVPLFTENLEHGDDDATSAIVSTTLVALVGVTVLTFLASPLLIWLYSSNHGKGVDPGQLRSVGVNLAFLFAPQVFFYGAMALGSALLNSRKRFFAAAWAPVLENLIIIAMLFSIPVLIHGRRGLDRAAHDAQLRLILGIGTTLSIVVMAVALLPALRRAGVRIRWRPDFRHPAVRRALVMSGWTIGYVVANQVAAQLVNVLAKPGSGGVYDYQTAFIFFQLPHGLLAVSLMTTFQPDLARAAVRHDDGAFHRRFLLGLRLLALLIVPAAVGYFVTSRSFVAGLHQTHYRIARFDLAAIFTVLGGFALGLIGFSAYLFTLRAFYARKDTRTPFLLNCVENALNVVFAILLVGRYGVEGLAYAYALAYSLAALLSLAVLLRRLPGFDLRGLIDTMARLVAAAAVMAGAVWAVARGLCGTSATSLFVGLGLSILTGIAVYAGIVTVLGVPSVVGLGRLRRR